VPQAKSTLPSVKLPKHLAAPFRLFLRRGKSFKSPMEEKKRPEVSSVRVLAAF
jgi:hypothetical protein